MRVFVTGASGFVGQRLMPRLRAAGFEAIGADRDVDVVDAQAVSSALERHRPDAIIHLAAISSVAESWRAPALCYRVNFVGTRTLLHSVAQICPGARVLLIGSADQYAAMPEPGPGLDESAPLQPRSPYARSKAAAEMLAAQPPLRDLDLVRVRAFNHTGAGQADHFVASSFARQVARIQLGRQPAKMAVGNLESVRDFLHVDDVLDAYLAMLDPALPADVYNVASGRETSIQAVLDRLIEIAGVSPEVVIDPERWRERDHLVGNASRLESRSDWRPRVPLDAILRELYEHWLEFERAA